LAYLTSKDFAAILQIEAISIRTISHLDLVVVLSEILSEVHLEVHLVPHFQAQPQLATPLEMMQATWSRKLSPAIQNQSTIQLQDR
jgi:hypothetical protein